MSIELLLYHTAFLAYLMLLTQSLALLWRANLFSLGHIGYACIGAYTSVALVKIFLPDSTNPSSHLAGLALLSVTLIVGGLAGGVISWLFCHTMKNLRSDYFAVATLIFSEMTLNVLDNFGWVGGALGTEVPYLFFPNVGAARRSYVIFYAVLGVSLNIFLLLWLSWVQNTWLGTAIRALSDDEMTAQMCGVRTHAIRCSLFTVGGAVAGVAGAFLVNFTTLVTPGDFNFTNGLTAVVCVVLGKLHPVRCLIAAAIFYILYELVKEQFFGVFGPNIGAGMAEHKEILMALILIISAILPVTMRNKRYSQTSEERYDGDKNC